MTKKHWKMKKIIMMTLLLLCSYSYVAAQKQAEIKFDKKIHNFGTFSEANAVQMCTFEFTNVGDAPLVLNQVAASCGCTATQYTKTPVGPGEKGKVEVCYNGAGKIPGHFKKSITVRTNGATESTRLYIEGEMTE